MFSCVFELLYVWLLSSRRNNTRLYFCTLYVCVVGYGWKDRERERKGNEIQCWMNYGVCIVTYWVLFWACKRMEFMCGRCRNKNRKAAVCFRWSAMYCMNCLRLPCRTDTSEIHYFSPFAFNKKHVPQLRCTFTVLPPLFQEKTKLCGVTARYWFCKDVSQCFLR